MILKTGDRDTIKKAICLIMECDHLSASASGLNKQANNRHQALTQLYQVLGISSIDAEIFYEDWEINKTSETT